MQQVPRKCRSFHELHIPCKRCGCCCVTVPCGLAPEDDYGVCSELIVHENLKTSCGLVDKGQIPDFIAEGEGCHLRKNPHFFRLLIQDGYIKQKKKRILERRI
jgi:hypothetical protein